jgi:predicted GH43/DUF377 family glycosyl hydrolase
MKDATRIFHRHPGGPLLQVKDYPGKAQLYNPSPAQVGDETILLVSVVEHAATHGYGRDVGQTRVARSSDGIHFELGEENFIHPQEEGEPWSLYHHFIDNRITKIDDWFYIITPVMVQQYESPVGMLGRTRDFNSYERLDIITAPRNRGASLFPEKINGLYYKLDRPGGGDGARGDIWISASPDLLHWGAFKPVLAAGYRFWNTMKIGPTPPIKTDQGWLDIIHGVCRVAGGTYYYIAAILLDLDEPWRLIGKTNSYLMMPEEPWEQHGNCDNTIFPCGAIADYEQDRIRLYYGACDQSIALATGSLSQTVEACLKGL